MLPKLIYAASLMALCVCIHAAGITFAVGRASALQHRVLSFWFRTRLLIRLAAWIILLHLFEIAAWGLFFAWQDLFPDVPSAVYFSTATYTTTGYGDLVLPPEWRVLASVEALTGILMCGWSTAVFFAVISHLNGFRRDNPVA